MFNHNIYENGVEVGTTSRGTRMMINREVAGATTEVFSGKMEQAHALAVDKAADHYATEPFPMDTDLTIANAFVKANEMPIALLMGLIPLVY